MQICFSQGKLSLVFILVNSLILTQQNCLVIQKNGLLESFANFSLLLISFELIWLMRHTLVFAFTNILPVEISLKVINAGLFFLCISKPQPILVDHDVRTTLHFVPNIFPR